MVNKVKFVKDDQKPNELKHYGVQGMKWGVRKDKYYDVIGPISNKLHKGLSLSPSIKIKTKISGSSNNGYIPDFSGKAKKVVKSNKKAGSKKSSKAKAQKALKEKIEKTKKSSIKKAVASSKSSSGAQKTIDKLKDNTLNSLDSIDHDFDDINFSSENKLGNTKFYAFKNANDNWVISDKNNKWVIPNGIEIDKQDFSDKLEKFEKSLEEIINSTGYEYTEEELNMWTTAAINKIISELRTPQQETNEKIAEVINDLLGSKEEIIDKSSQTKIDENVSKILSGLEKKKKS